MLVPLFALFAAGLASGKDLPAAETARIPFTFKGGSGVGPEAELNILAIAPDTEIKVGSWAIVQAVQSLQLSLKNPGSGTLRLAPKRWYATGAPAPLDPKLIAEHNKNYPALALDPKYIYAAGYEIMYEIEGREFLLTCKAILQRRGAQSGLKPVRDPYSNAFFCRPILQEIIAFFERLRKSPDLLTP